jgi:Ca2+/Na+ antiporter
MIAIGLAISVRVIPHATDMMVNAAAGLAERHLGAQYRTLVINCSTNNPELITMLLALFFSGKQGVGGIATPLGSNFANIYLIFFVAFVWLFGTMWLRDRVRFYQLLTLLRRERRLVFWHVGVSFVMFVLASAAYQALTIATPPSKWNITGVVVLCCIGVAVFVWLESGLRRARPDVFHEIDDEHHVASWRQLILGTAGLMAACYAVNAMFEVSTTLYSTKLAGVLGNSVFAAMHYFLGALITSLPELNVAISNYRRLTAPDLNTGLASASASNMSNLAIAAIGGLIALCI